MAIALKTKLLILNLLVIGAASSVLVIGLYELVAYQMRQEMWGFLYDEFNEYSLEYAEVADQPDQLQGELEDHLTLARMRYPTVCRVYDPQGEVVAFVENVPGTPDIKHDFVKRALEGEKIRYMATASDGSTQYWFAMAQIQSPGGKIYVFELGMNVRFMYHRIHHLRSNLLLYVPCILIVALAAAWWVTSRSFRPLGLVLANLKRIRSSSLDQRLPDIPEGGELGQLVVAINEMLAEIDNAFHLAQEFTADAAHELRTPLARLSVALERALRRNLSADEARAVLDDAYEECVCLQRLISDLMLLARLDTGEIEEQAEDCDIDAILRDAEELWQTACEERGIELQLTYPGDVHLHGRPMLVRRLIMNLVDNALRYTPNSGWIHISAEACGQDMSVVVENSGEGVPEEALIKIFNRFYRADSSRNAASGGTGLGLSICRKIVELHEGSINVQSAAGESTKFQILLPIAPNHT